MKGLQKIAGLVLTDRERLSLYEKLADYTEEGISLYFAVKEIDEHYRQSHNMVSWVTSQWVKQARESGFSMTVAKGWIPDSELGLIISGERNRTPYIGFNQAAIEVDRKIQAMSKIMALMFGPMIAGIIAIAAVAAFHLKFAPKMTKFIPIEYWTRPAILLDQTSGLMVDYKYLLLTAAIAVYVLITWTLPNVSGIFRKYLDYLPPWSFYRINAASGFATALSGRVAQNVSFITAIREIKEYSSPYVIYHCEKIIENLNRGDLTEAEALDTGLFPKRLAQDLKTFGRAGKFDKALARLGDRMAKQGMDSMASAGRWMNVSALLALGGIIIWMYTAVIYTNMNYTTALSSTSAKIRH